MITQLILVRHAEVEPRYHGVFGGRIDMGLSDRGHSQAAALANSLRELSPGVIYASPMKRVQDTLKPLAGNGSPVPVIVPELREIDFGAWTGLRWEEVKERFGFSAFEWLDLIDSSGIAGAERTADLRTRIEPFFREVLREHSGKKVAVVCHGGVIRVLLSIALDLPLPRTAAFDIDYASLSIVEVRPQGTHVQLLNFAPWRTLAS